MQYLLLMCFDETAEQRPEDDCRVPGAGADALATWVRETEARGVRLLSGARLELGADARTVRDRCGELLVTDGPFAETKELVAGYAIFEVASKAEIIELTKRFLNIMGRGESEIRLMPDQPAYQRA